MIRTRTNTTPITRRTPMTVNEIPTAPGAPPTGKRQRKHHKWPWIVLGVFVVIGIIAAVSPKTAEAPAAAPPTAASSAPPVAGSPATSVRDGKLEFTVQKVQAGVKSFGTADFGVKAQGAFTVVTVKISNIGTEPQTFFDSNTKGFDRDGRELAPSTEAARRQQPASRSRQNRRHPGVLRC